MMISGEKIKELGEKLLQCHFLRDEISIVN
jgi:hypothetical protein